MSNDELISLLVDAQNLCIGARVHVARLVFLADAVRARETIRLEQGVETLGWELRVHAMPGDHGAEPPHIHYTVNSAQGPAAEREALNAGIGALIAPGQTKTERLPAHLQSITLDAAARTEDQTPVAGACVIEVYELVPMIRRAPGC
jgi:hypothetical protein